jgi:hypothetical protein
MSFKTMNGTLVMSAFVAITALSAAVSCGGDDPEDKPDSGSGTMGGTADGGGTMGGSSNPDCTDGYRNDKMLTLVNVLAQDPSGFIAASHEVQLLDLETGMPLNPPVTTTTKTGTGQFTFKKVPCDAKTWIHVKGVGPKTDSMSTYDSLSLNAPDSGEVIIRISSAGTSTSAEATGGFTGKDDQVAIGGAVYTVDDSGKRTGSIGCATVYIDDQPHPALTNDQRYIAVTGLPTPLDKQSKTLRSGKFYFGNVTTGPHKLKVSIDGGATFLTLLGGSKELSFSMPFARKDASSDLKSVLVLLGMDVPGANPTPASCPTP